VIYCECGPNSPCSDKTCNCIDVHGPLSYDDKGRLKRTFPSVIHECNSKCSCSIDSCLNRVTQKGRQHKVAIFKTANGTGWGLKALERIPRGTFIFEYVGEYINDEQADIRDQLSRYEGRPSHSYFFDLDLEEKSENKYTIDAALKGNVSHFVNHSCEPNLENVSVFINCQDKDLPRIMFFTAREIRAEEELTFDYKMNVNIRDGGSESGESSIAEEEEMIEKTGDQDSGIESPRNGTPEREVAISSDMLDMPSTSRGPQPSTSKKKDDDDFSRIAAVKKFMPTIQRIACMCGSKKCRGFLY